jgi:hypothetical protein
MYSHERSLVEKFKGKPFCIVGVNSDADRTQLKRIVKDHAISWRSFWDDRGKDGSIADRWNIRNWRTLYLIDHKGIIRFRLFENPGERVLNDLIDHLVLEAQSTKTRSNP